MLFIHETLLVYKLETFKNCKEAKHIMIMIPAIIYPLPFWKNLLFIDYPRENSKSASPPLLADVENFSASPPVEMGEDIVFSLTLFNRKVFMMKGSKSMMKGSKSG